MKYRNSRDVRAQLEQSRHLHAREERLKAIVEPLLSQVTVENASLGGDKRGFLVHGVRQPPHGHLTGVPRS